MRYNTYIDYLDGVYDEWVIGTTYGVFDNTSPYIGVITYDSIVYKSLQAANIGNTPDVSPLYWEVATDGNVWIEFYPANVAPFKLARESNQFFKRWGWGEVKIKNNPNLYAVASNPIYKLYKIIKDLDFTTEIKIKFTTGIGATNHTIEGYFGTNDCKFEDNGIEKTLTVTPTIQDNYSSLLENWENKINFNDIEYSADEVDLNIRALGTRPIGDWVLASHASGERIARITIPTADFISPDYLNGTISSYFDLSTQAPNRDVFATPPAVIYGRDGFTLSDREEILGEDFSQLVPEDWLSIDEYGKFDDTQLTSDIVTRLSKTYKSIHASNEDNPPETSPLWWKEIYVGEIYPEKGDYELSEVTVYKGALGLAGGIGLNYWIYSTTRFSRDEYRKVDVIDIEETSGFEPPTGSGWHMRSIESVEGQDGHLWTRKPYNAAFKDSWALQDLELNPTGASDTIYWTERRTSKIEYPSSTNSKTINTTVLPKDFLEYILQNTNSLFASSSIISTFLFNDNEASLPILAPYIGENKNYVTMGDNYLSTIRMVFTRDFIPDLDPSDVSTFPDVNLKKVIEDLNKLFKDTLYWFLDDSLDLHIEHIKYLDLTMNSEDLRTIEILGEAVDRKELEFTESWKYDKTKMYNRIELNQVNASGVDFTENLITFPKIVSNKRGVDIKQKLETEIFTTDLRYVVENSSDLENGVLLIATSTKNTLEVTPQIDEIGFTGDYGRAIVTAGEVSALLDVYDGSSLEGAISNFVANYSSNYLDEGITLSIGTDKIIFTKDAPFTSPTTSDERGNIVGTPYSVQAYSVIGSITSLSVPTKVGFVSGVSESNGLLAFSNLLYDFGRYEGTWILGNVNGEDETVYDDPFETTSRTKDGKEIQVRGAFDSLFFTTNLGIGLLKSATIDFNEENTKLNLSYRYNSVPDTDGFVIMVQKEDEFAGAVDKWMDIGNYET